MGNDARTQLTVSLTEWMLKRIDDFVCAEGYVSRQEFIRAVILEHIRLKSREPH
jgi:metal-responsive CopG/Arc/MetJ family transcriptional regulator